jgi:hypothetical protein
MTITEHVDFWERQAELHRDAMRSALETADDSKAERLARAADDVARAIREYAGAL